MQSILKALGDRRVAIRNEEETQKGFTLIELLVVVIIIGILAAIAIPVFLSQREGAWKSSVESDVKNAVLAVETYATNHNGNPDGADGTFPEDTVEGLSITVSDNNTIVIEVGTDHQYTITGTNSDLGEGDGKTLVYTSSTGKQEWE